MIEKEIYMARNPVQFQKGISLNEFLSLYGTEDPMLRRTLSMAVAERISVPSLRP